MIDLSVVVVSFNTRDLLRSCLESVCASASYQSTSPLSVEVWVVDNASSDGSANMVRREFPQARLVVNDSNVGFAAANNQAIQQANGQYVLLLNPDTVVLDDALLRLVDFAAGHEKVGAVGARLLNPDGSFQHSCFRFPNLWMSFFDFFPLNHRVTNSRLNGRYPLNRYEKPFPIDHPLGACLLVRKSVVDQVGLLDEDFFIYCEEVDWCLRIKQAGWDIYCVPEAKVIHYGAQSTQQFRGRMLVELHRSRNLLFEKHYSPLFRWASRQIVRLGLAREALRGVVALVTGKLSRRDLDERLESYWQIFRM